MASKVLNPTDILSKIAIFILLLIFLQSIYTGLTTGPMAGDSSDYLIPIAKMILTGQIMHPPPSTFDLFYYPGASNALLSLFLQFRSKLFLLAFFLFLVYKRKTGNI